MGRYQSRKILINLIYLNFPTTLFILFTLFDQDTFLEQNEMAFLA